MFGMETNFMSNTIYLVIFITLFSCSTSKEYKLYRRDKTINYPKEELTLSLINDTTGLFFNKYKDKEAFNQRFSFTKSSNKYLIIEDITPTSKWLISLNQGDTIVVHKNQLHFFYNGDKKYLLSFKKKRVPTHTGL